MKNPLTPDGVEPATFRFVAQHLNHCATAVPRLWGNAEKFCTAGQVTDGNMAHEHCILDTKGYKHTLRTCNTYCFSAATMVARTRLNVTLKVLLGVCSDVAEGSVILKHDTVSMGNRFSTFGDNVMASYSLAKMLSPKLGTVYPLTRCHISQD